MVMVMVLSYIGDPEEDLDLGKEITSLALNILGLVLFKTFKLY